MNTILSLLSPRKQPAPPAFPDEPHKPHTKAKTYSKKDRVRAQRALARMSGESEIQHEPSRSSIVSAPIENEEVVTMSQPPPDEDEDMYNATSEPISTKKSPKQSLQTGKTTSRAAPPEIPADDQMEVEHEDIYNATPEPSSAKKSPKRSPQTVKRTSGAGPPEMSAVDEIQVKVAYGSEERFKRFLGHHWVGDSIEIQVEWEQGSPTWEPEKNLHEDALDALLAYWKEQGGRPPNPRDPELYEIFAVRKHSRNRKKVCVEWVGFAKSDTTWLATSVVEETAPELLEEYWQSLPSKKKT